MSALTAGSTSSPPWAARPAPSSPAVGAIAGPAVSPDGSKVAYVVDGRDVAVASLAEAGPWPVRLSAGADFCFDPSWSADGTRVAWAEWDVPAMPWDDSRIMIAPADAFSCAGGRRPSLTGRGQPGPLLPGRQRSRTAL